MTRQFIPLYSVLFIVCAGALADASLSPLYNDGADEGFNSTDPPHTVSSDDGNPGTTLGEQRRWAFERALEYWGRRLDSGIVIEVAAEMNNLWCSSGSALLGSAGPETAVADWSPAAGGASPAFADTWYVISLANRIANTDLKPAIPDISSEFNKNLDESNNCLGSNTWYYALGDAPPGTVSFFTTAVHEVGHGIGFLTFVDLASGLRLLGRDDVYMQFLEDHSTGKVWPNMTDSERAASATDTTDLHWVGSNVRAALSSLSGGVSGGHVQMYAPDPLRGGASVSHWDINVDDNNNNDEIMEPAATGIEKLTVTDELLHDLGWNDVAANNCAFFSYRLLLSSLFSGSNTHNACVSVTYDGAIISDGNTSATAGRQVVLKNGFSVEQGASFGVEIDPEIGL